MKSIMLIIMTSVLQLTAIFVSAQQTGDYLGTQGQRYNKNDLRQGFVYNLKVDSNNTIVGTVIQENRSIKRWCGHLKVIVKDKNGKPLGTYATQTHSVESTSENSSKTYTEKIKWKIKDGGYIGDMELEAIEDGCK